MVDRTQAQVRQVLAQHMIAGLESQLHYWRQTAGGLDTGTNAAYSRQDELLTVEELADYLKVPKSWVYIASAEGKLPTVRVGRHLRFVAVDVLCALREPPQAVSEERSKRS